VAQASFLACRSPWQPLAAVIAAAVVNLVGDLVLVCGMGRGIGGAAWATIASQATMAAGLVYALLLQGKEKRRRRLLEVEGEGAGAAAGGGALAVESGAAAGAGAAAVGAAVGGGGHGVYY
jgi:peptidoglycan biosynthesis protein MviN/MurJ (putative lipid II flippase)